MSTGACDCPGPGHCPRWGKVVSRTGWKVCRGGDPRSVEAYFGVEAGTRTVNVARTPGQCAYLGPLLLDEHGRPRTKLCPSCRGTVRLKLRACDHPTHAADPTTTEKECKRCRDFAAERPPPRVSDNPELDYWRGGS